jgi:NADH:ubiquinone oxidoreductase subunit F (NADH-binding)
MRGRGGTARGAGAGSGAAPGSDAGAGAGSGEFVRRGHDRLPRLLARLRADGSAMALGEHEHVHGPLPAGGGPGLIEAIEASGLRGRGGADFPTARKLRAVAGRRRASAVVVNGGETEPASAKDRLLLSRLPHLVLDGAVLAAAAVGAGEVIVRTRASSVSAQAALEDAVAQRIGDPVAITMLSGPEGYVTGEESAVVNHLNGGPALPTLVPPRPYERGYRGRPTLIQNPETLAQIALIARFGPEWFRELGTDADPGSALVTISGAVAAPGVYELAFGTPMTELIAAAGGGTESLRALLIGGYFGTWVRASRALDLRLARQDLRSVGCTLGSGVVVALGERSCGLHESARIIDYLASQSAGQCGPCVHGLRAIADAVAGLAAGTATAGERERVLRWSADVRGRGACHHPDGAVRFVESAIDVFAEEIEHHRGARCRAAPAGVVAAAATGRGAMRSVAVPGDATGMDRPGATSSLGTPARVPSRSRTGLWS